MRLLRLEIVGFSNLFGEVRLLHRLPCCKEHVNRNVT